jgi:hypothetical protein
MRAWMEVGIAVGEFVRSQAGRPIDDRGAAYGCCILATGFGLFIAAWAEFSSRRFKRNLAEKQARESSQALQVAQAEERRAQAAREQLERLVKAYGEEGAQRVLRKELWMDAPVAAVYQMFDRPVVVDDEVTKTKTIQVMKFQPLAHKGRYGLVVTVENGLVVGWKNNRS